MDEEWGEWARPVPLLAAPMRVSWQSCEISPRTTRSPSGLWDGAAVRYRSTPGSGWEDQARIAAWAKPRGSAAWPFAALVYLSFCHTASNRPGTHSGVPRWRWSWVVYDPALIEPLESAAAPSDYWARCCSATIGSLVAELGRPSPGRTAAAGDPTRDRWAG